MNKFGIDLVVESMVLLLEEPFRWERCREGFFYLHRVSRFLPAKAQFGTYLMNIIVVIPNGPEVLESEMCPIMEGFRHDNCLLLFIPRLEGLKQSKWGFLLQILSLVILVDMVPYDVQGNVFLLIPQRPDSSWEGILWGLDCTH
jgi:hypothetical protein